MSDNINLLSTEDFSPAMSSDEICFGEDVLLCLTDVVNGKADINHTHTGYASSDHSHSEYAALSDIESLQNAISNKADTTHTHSGYASQSDLELLEDVVDTKANENHTHAEYASSSHTHDEYAPISHSHSEYASASHVHDDYATSTHTHNEYSVVGHDHDENYASIDHVHNNYATTSALDEVSTAVSGKANASHSHDDRYYTETEVDTKLAGKADSSHTHTGVYDASGSAENALTEAKSYTDTKIDALVGEGASTTLDTIGEISSAIEDNQDTIDLLNSAIANKANATHAHVISDITNLQVALDAKASNSHTHTAADVGAAASNHSHNDIYYTETEVDSLLASKSNSSHTHNYVPTSRTINGKALSSNITLSASDVGALSGDTDIPSALSDLTADSTHRLVTDAEKATWNAKSNFSGSYNDLTNKPTIPSISGLASETYVDEAVSAKADSSHTHTIANVTGLQSALDGKAASSHGTHVSYSTTAPVMDGTASVGTAATVARSDHKHPTDTSRAAQTSLDSHTSNKSNPHGVSLTQLGITATAAELNKLDGVTATTAELNYVDGVTSNIQTQLNGKAASSHTHSAATTSAAGLMSANDKAKLDGIAAGANAYTLPTASSTLGGVKTTSTVTSASGYTACPIISGVPYYKDTNTTYSLGSFGITATAAELNYIDGVTSNIQTQLNAKASSSHNHSGVYANASHTHTASAVGAVASGDVATVSEVETYLGI